MRERFTDERNGRDRFKNSTDSAKLYGCHENTGRANFNDIRHPDPVPGQP
jgi:hypothetical protein